MTVNKVIRAKDTGVTKPGFLWNPGTVSNHGRYPRSALTGTTITHLGFLMRVRSEEMTTDHTLCGWANGFATLRTYTDRTITVAAYNGGAIGNAKSDPIPEVLGRDMWLHGVVQASDAMCSYWYSYDDVQDPALVTWIPIGTPIGSRPGLVPSTSNSNFLYIGASSATSFPTGLFAGRIYYFQEEINLATNAVADYQGAVLPPLTTLTTTANPTPATFHPATPLVPEEHEGLWIGDKRYWPLKDGHINHGQGVVADYSNVYTADAAEYNIGDLDARWYGVMNWAAASTGPFSQWDVNGGQRGWLIETGGSTQARASLSTTGVNQFSTPLVTIPYGVGQPGGLRITRVASTGLTRLWFSTDGVNWTPQPAGDATVAAGTALFNSTATIRFGAYDVGTSGRVTGKTFYAELRNGIDGPVVFRHGPQSLRNVARKQASWVCETGQTVNRMGSASGTVTPWIYPTVDIDDILDLYKGDTRTWPGGDGYVSTYRTAGNYLSTPSYPAIDVDLVPGFTLVTRIRRHGATWTPQDLIVKQSAYVFDIDVDGWGGTAMVPRLFYDYNDHANWAWHFGDPLPDTNGWVDIGFTYRATNGAGSYEMRFWISLDDGSSWTQSGPTRTGTDTMVISTAPANPLYIGGNPPNARWSDIDMAYASIRQGTGAGGAVGGTEVFRLDRDAFKVGRRTTSLMAKGAVQALYPITGYVSTPDPGVVPFPCCFRMKIRPSLGSAYKWVVTQFPGGGDHSWGIEMSGIDAWGYYRSTDGSAVSTNSSTHPPAVVLPQDPKSVVVPQLLAMTFDQTVSVAVKTWISSDGATWTQYSSGTWGTWTQRDSAGEMRVGRSQAYNPGTYDDYIYWVELLTGLDPNDSGATLLWRFDASEWVSGTSWVDARGKTWTMSAAGAVQKVLDPVVPVTVVRAGATPLTIYPTVSEMLAKWDVSQWDDGSKWV